MIQDPAPFGAISATLAFWLGSVATDANGHAVVDVKLPESLTTYRIMAIAADRVSRFGPPTPRSASTSR